MYDMEVEGASLSTVYINSYFAPKSKFPKSNARPKNLNP